jgi:hypothetical protein
MTCGNAISRALAPGEAVRYAFFPESSSLR